ncbi:MAG: 3-deoxy-7-phosphoheptulonate synthase [Candidatus Methylomirabilales bacterium]
MIIVMKATATQQDIDQVVAKIRGNGLTPHISRGIERTIVGAIGDERVLREVPFEALPGVEEVHPILKPFKLASRDFRPESSVVQVGGAAIGAKRLAIIGGPCSVEGRDMLLEVAGIVKRAGGALLRGGAFKPRTSPYTFQGMGEDGLKLLAEARDITGLPIVTELMDPRDTDLVMQYADVIQIGARNMQNFRLLKEVGSHRRPVLLKRGMMATMKELLMSAEYIMAEGNYDVILCERGIRTFEDYTRNTLDLSAVPALKQLTHLPVIVDPSHGVGKWDLVAPMALAAIAAGADGLMIEVHPRPEEALSDGAQSLLPKRFETLLAAISQLAPIVGRSL